MTTAANLTRAQPSTRPTHQPARRYDIEADWILMSTCNFRCAYCYWDEPSLSRKIRPLARPEELSGFFDKTGARWLLHLTGGEPFIYPRFVDLCMMLTRNHLISINTNADSPRIQHFVQVIDPSRVAFLHCSVHPQQRQERKRVDYFLRHYHLLRESGFVTFASCVFTPDLLSSFAAVWHWYASRGVVIIPKALQGHYLGKKYPQSYTISEKSTFREYTQRARDHYGDQFERLPELPTINPLLDDVLFLEVTRDYRGQLCEAGWRFVRIWEDGSITRCGRGDVLGNIVDGAFERQSFASVCADRECVYFCEKYRVRG